MPRLRPLLPSVVRPARSYFVILTTSAILLFSAACKPFGDFGAGKKDDTVAGASVNPNQVVTPVFSPTGGTYAPTPNVSMTSTTPTATVCYTTDGVTTPTCNATTGTCITGTTYAGALSVGASQTIMALACKAGMINSTVATGVYTIDGTAPVLTLTTPATGVPRTNTQVTYDITDASGGCASASITWTWVSGNPDPGGAPAGTHTQALTGGELVNGTHSNVTLTNNPSLVDGATYNVAFTCTDAVGNVGNATTQTNVLYDFAVPVISAIAPANGATVNTTQVSYTLSEVCNTGSVNWTWTGGTAGTNQSYALSIAAEKTAGPHTITPAVALTSGAIYTVSFDCTDMAGQVATTVSSTSVTFDNVAPVIGGVSPVDSAYVSTTQVSYSLTEACASASITWTRTGGNPDPGGVPAGTHAQALTAGELTAGPHNNIIITNNPTLADGAVYSMAINCTDAAGNAATAVTRNTITFDPSAVVISAVAPAGSSYQNSTKVSYTLSEACASGNVTWTRTGGNPDAGGAPAGTHVQALTAGELLAGTHANITLTNNPTLVDGTIYSVQFNCTDLAANVSTPITSTNVTYDFTLPVISAVAPATSAFVNNQQVSYTLSEQCASGGINWTWTGGAGSGSFNQGLVPIELTAGSHNNFIIANNPTLVSGAIYTVTFSCTDLAGNIATAVNSTSVTFDNTPPIVSIQNLKNNGTIHTGHVIGPASDNVGIVSLQFELENNGTWNAITIANPWKFALPMGPSTWPERSSHQIRVRASDAAGNVTTSPLITVKKGNNRDINGDGYEDFVASAHLYNTNRGGIYVHYGQSGSIPSSTVAAPTILSATNSDYYGRNTAMGDFNGDGFADLAVCSPGDGTAALPGKVIIYHGQAGTLNTTPVTTLNGVSNLDLFGGMAITADFDNDGYSDLALGAIGYNANSQIGRVYIYRSTGTAISATVWKTLTGEASAHNFGGAIASGDFNGDNQTDLVVAAPRYNNGTFDGRVYAFYTVSSLGANTTAGGGNILVTGVGAEYMGASLASGDINGDGISDLVIGAVQNSANAGRAYLHYGAAGTGLPVSPSTTLSGLATPGYFGTSIHLRDMNVDGFDDIIVGAHGNGVNTGGTYIFFGQASILGALTTASGGVYSVLGQDSTSFFGRGVSAVDANGDGDADLLIGAPRYSAQIGRAYILYGSGSGPINNTALGAGNTLLDGPGGQTAQYATSFNR
ncbi:MAG: FG-GAP-like repeat-containing protein [Turneriella sp.]